MKEVYIIMSSSGGILLNFQGIGICYSNLEKAREALKSKNEWAKSKGYKKEVYNYAITSVTKAPKSFIYLKEVRQ